MTRPAANGADLLPPDVLATLLAGAGPLAVIDGTGRCRFANAAAAALAIDPAGLRPGADAAAQLPILADRAIVALIARARAGAEGVAEAMLPSVRRWFLIRAVPAGEHTLLYLDETTERRAAEFAVDEAAETIRLASLAGATGNYSIDLASSTIWFSERALRIYGMDPAEGSSMPSDRLLSLVLPQDLEENLAAVQGARAHPGAVYDVTYRVRRPADGEIRTIHSVGEVLRDRDGVARTLVGSISDVTDRSAAEEALRISEDRLRKTVEGVDAIISFREDGHAEVIQSPQVERILGYRPEDLTDNLAWNDLVHPDDLAVCLAAWRGPDPGWQLTYRIRRADGTYIWVEDRGRWIDRGDGRGRGLIGVITDITERQRVEQALAESEERLRHTVEGVDAVITYLESGGQRTVQSPQVERILGYPPETLVSEDAWFALIHPDDLPRCMEVWNASTPTWLLTYRMRRADGTWIWVDDRGQRIYHDDGRPPGYVGVVTDATDRVEAGQARRLADERRRRFFDANIVGTVVAEASGPILEANDYFLRLIGRTREELEDGKVSWQAITTPDSLAADEDAVAQCRESGTSRPYEKAYARPDGSTVDALLVLASMPGPGEQIAGFVLDLTERNAAAAEMARLVAAIEQTSESVVVTDLEAKIQYVNPAFELVSGYSRAEVIGQNPRMLQSGAHPREFYVDMWAVLDRGETWRGELVNRRRDGSHYTEIAAISPIRDASGRITAYVGVKRDVTAERELQARLSQAQRLEAIGQLAGGIAHDFNNLLAVIRGYADLARATMPSPSPATEDLDQVVLAADRASSLTRQLLLFSRRQATEPQVLDPATVIEGLAPMLRRLLGEHIELEVAAAEPTAGFVRVDPGQLEQVVINLSANSRDAMPGGGRLSLRTQRQDGEDGSWVRITVADTGVGMDDETLQRVFEPFFTTKAVGDGTGLGLSTVYGIVAQSGGRVSVDSTPGQGTTFTIDLPRVEVKARSAADTAEPAPDVARRPHTVLLVEDDAAVRGLTRRMLGSLGHTVTVAASGAEALGLIEVADRLPDILVTDVRMPGIQGPELARRLRDRRPDLPVVFTSGFSAELGDQVAVAGAQVLDKPFDLAHLDAALRAALGPEG